MALFEDLGVQGAFGIAQLATIQRRFGNDSEAMQALSLLVQRCVATPCYPRRQALASACLQMRSPARALIAKPR